MSLRSLAALVHNLTCGDSNSKLITLRKRSFQLTKSVRVYRLVLKIFT